MTTPTGQVVSDEIPATPPPSRAVAAVVTLVAVAMSLFHMYVAAFGPPEAFIFRGTHLLFALTLVYLLYPFRGGRGWAWRVLDFALLATRRRHRQDGMLVTEGPDADAWLDIVQAFVGQPGPGRAPQR